MARTIRKKGRNPSWLFEKTKYKRGHGMVELNEKEYVRNIHRYHSDAGISKWDHVSPWFCNHVERKHRAKTRTEFSKFFKDLDHEIQIRNKPRLPWWD